jgi:hypothetical protein
MKKLILRFPLLLSLLLFSSPSYAEWTYVVSHPSNGHAYVDFERIRKVDGYVYFWQLADYAEPDSTGVLSVKIYKQGDCKLFRFKVLSWAFYKTSMGEGAPDSTVNDADTEWTYPLPDSITEWILKAVCNTP